MPSPTALTRYSFRIRARNGVIVDKVLILGRDEVQARERLSQIYPHSTVLSCCQEGLSGSANLNAGKASFEDIIDLINH